MILILILTALLLRFILATWIYNQEIWTCNLYNRPIEEKVPYFDIPYFFGKLDFEQQEQPISDHGAPWKAKYGESEFTISRVTRNDHVYPQWCLDWTKNGKRQETYWSYRIWNIMKFANSLV